MVVNLYPFVLRIRAKVFSKILVVAGVAYGSHEKIIVALSRHYQIAEQGSDPRLFIF